MQYSFLPSCTSGRRYHQTLFTLSSWICITLNSLYLRGIRSKAFTSTFSHCKHRGDLRIIPSSSSHSPHPIAPSNQPNSSPLSLQTVLVSWIVRSRHRKSQTCQLGSGLVTSWVLRGHETLVSTEEWVKNAEHLMNYSLSYQWHTMDASLDAVSIPHQLLPVTPQSGDQWPEGRLPSGIVNRSLVHWL